MSLPRPVVKGRTWLVTRRCSERRFFLVPCRATRWAVLYAVGVAAERHGVALHALQQMSNHLHTTLTDVRGEYPAFLSLFHHMVAKLLNVHWGRWESLWAAEQTSMVELTDEAAVLDKSAYALVNPVMADLVATVDAWPGVSSWAVDGTLRVKRPDWYFDPEGRMPAEVRIRFTAPPGWDEGAWKKALRREVRRRERLAAKRRAAKGVEVEGRRKVMAQDPFASPVRPAPRRGVSPRVAGRNKWRRVEALQRNRTWLAAYRAALEDYRCGLEVIFPAGTYQLYVDGHVARHPT